MSVSNRSVFSNLVWRYLERFLAQIITFTITVVLARLLTPDDYGAVAVLTVIVHMLEIFSTRGFNQALIQKKQIEEIDYSTVFWINMVIELLLYVLVYCCAPIISSFYGNQLLTPLLRVLAIRLLIFGFNSIQQAYVQRNMLFKKFFFSTSIGTGISGVVGLVLAYNGAGAWALVLQSLINPLIDTCVLFLTIEWKPKIQFSMESFKQMRGFGIRSFLMGILDSTYDNLRALIVGKKYSSADLAYYNKGQNIPSLVINNTQTAASNVFFSTLSREKDTYHIKERMREFTRLMYFVLCPLMIGIACTSREIIVILLTEKWAPSIPFMIIYCVTYLTWVPQMPLILGLQANGNVNLTLRLSLIQRFAGILSLILVINKGPVYIALAGMIIDIMITIVTYSICVTHLEYHFEEIVRDLWKTSTATLLMVIALIVMGFFLQQFNVYIVLLIKVTLGVAIYAIVSFVIRSEELYIIFRKARSFLYERKS